MKTASTCTLAALALAATQTSALAHAYLVDSVPARKQEVMHPLGRIKLTFSAKADHFSTAKLVDERGAVLASTMQQEAGREIALPAPTLEPGPYHVHYRVVSADGDVVEGKVDFVVTAEAGHEGKPLPEVGGPGS